MKKSTCQKLMAILRGPGSPSFLSRISRGRTLIAITHLQRNVPACSFVLSTEKSNKLTWSALPSNASVGARTSAVLFVHTFNRDEDMDSMPRDTNVIIPSLAKFYFIPRATRNRLKVWDNVNVLLNHSIKYSAVIARNS